MPIGQQTLETNWAFIKSTKSGEFVLLRLTVGKIKLY